MKTQRQDRINNIIFRIIVCIDIKHEYMIYRMLNYIDTRLLGFDNVHYSSLMETHRTLRRCWVLQEDAILSTRSFIH